MITGDGGIRDKAMKLSDINRLFQKIKSAFRVPNRENMSEDIPYYGSVEESCNIVIEGKNVYLHADIDHYIFAAAKHIILRYEQHKSLLCANNKDNTIPRTNTSLKQLFRKIRRNARKRSGNDATGSIINSEG